MTPLTGEGSLGPGVRARAFGSTPGFFVSLAFLATAWAPLARVVAPLCVTVPLRGARVPRSRVRALCSRDPILVQRPPRCAPSRVPARVPRLCPVECMVSLVRLFIRECSGTFVRAPFSVLCALTSAPPVFVRMAVESGGGFPPRRGPGVGPSTQRFPAPSSPEHPPSPDAGGKGGTEAGLASCSVVWATSGAARRAGLFWEEGGGSQGPKIEPTRR